MESQSILLGALLGTTIVLLILNLVRSRPVEKVIYREDIPVAFYDRPYWGYWGGWYPGYWGGYGSGGYSGGIWTGGHGGGGHHGGGGGGHGGGGHGGGGHGGH